ncbi:VENN motif pre-toxin domain-containing protein [Orbus wheelerorum]|uniref:VENN motif pre-toxin domain-containing protein n=1 Tax=Orbus wheelerorum TaxID=3074111 RepID=UPI00370D511F
MNAIDLVRDIVVQGKNLGQKYSKIEAQLELKAQGGVSNEQKDAAIAALGKNASDKDIENYTINQLVQKNGIGSMGDGFSKGLDAASAIVIGIISGDITGGLAGASAPYLAEQIKKQTGHYDEAAKDWKTDDKAANLIAHALLGAAVAAAQGNSALAGGVGAVSGEVVADYIRKNLYDDRDPKDLTEQEKANISALAQIASGLAVAAGSGGSIADTGTAVAGSKNTVENNELQQLTGFNRNDNFIEIFDKQHEERVAKIAADICTSGMSAQVCTGKVNEVIKKEFDKGVSQLIEFTTLSPLVGEADSIYIIWKGRSLSGDEVDRLWGVLGVFTLGYGQKVKMVDKLGNELISTGGKIINKTDNILKPTETNNSKSSSNLGAQASSPPTKVETPTSGSSIDVPKVEHTGGISDSVSVTNPGSQSSSTATIPGKGMTGTTSNGYKVSNGSDTIVAKAELEHLITQSRINIQNGDNKTGWNHVVERHFSDKNASQFTISQSELKTILQSKQVSKVPISRVIDSADGPRFERVITFDKNIGVDKFSKGNLITTTPGRIK